MIFNLPKVGTGGSWLPFTTAQRRRKYFAAFENETFDASVERAKIGFAELDSFSDDFLQ